MDNFLIIGKSDFEGHIDVSSNLNADKKLNMHIRHAQDFDLCKLMGESFYYDFMSTFTVNNVQKVDAPQAYKDLYNGNAFKVGDNDWINPGLKPVLVYFAGARLMQNLDLTISPNLLSRKVNEFSEPISNASKNFAINAAENQATAYWRKVVTYMNTVKASYPLFFTDCGCDTGSNINRPKRVAVGGDGFNYHRRENRHVLPINSNISGLNVKAIFTYTEARINAQGLLELTAKDAAIAQNLELLSAVVNRTEGVDAFYDKPTDLISGFGNWYGVPNTSIVLKFI